MLGLLRIIQKHLIFEFGDFIVFGINLGEIWEVFGKIIVHNTNTYRRLLKVRKRNFKGRCTKRYVPKCMDICRTYDALQEHTLMNCHNRMMLKNLDVMCI